MFGKCFGFLNVSVASQSEITRRLDKSTIYESEGWKCESSGFLSRSEITHDEHPLSLGKSSIWNQFFQVSYWPELIRYQFHRWSILLFLFSILWISFYFVNFFSHFSFGGEGRYPWHGSLMAWANTQWLYIVLPYFTCYAIRCSLPRNIPNVAWSGLALDLY